MSVRSPKGSSASASDVCEVLRREKQAWQGRREGAYHERTCPTENAARRSFFARRTLPTLLAEALSTDSHLTSCGSKVDRQRTRREVQVVVGAPGVLGCQELEDAGQTQDGRQNQDNSKDEVHRSGLSVIPSCPEPRRPEDNVDDVVERIHREDEELFVVGLRGKAVEPRHGKADDAHDQVHDAKDQGEDLRRRHRSYSAGHSRVPLLNRFGLHLIPSPKKRLA